MKKNLFIMLAAMIVAGSPALLPAAPPADPAALAKADARQALALANEWKWSQPGVKSFITPREIVFQFPDGREKKILLPQDKMMVAVAPYLNQTHT